MSEIHFISGLPRSGSTLLAAILRQNPAFTASMMSPVGQCVVQLQQSMSGTNEAKGFISNVQRERMLRGLFWSYYWDAGVDGVIFDNNRRWCAHAPLLSQLFPESKIVCCVRPPAHIVDSIERLVRAHPLELSTIFGLEPNTTVYDRVAMLLKPPALLGYALNSFRDAFYGPHRERLVLVEYAELAQHPGPVMQRLHDELKLPPFAYDFNNIEPIPGAEEFDRMLGLPGLHALKSRVVYEPQNSILPPDVYHALPPAFWQVKKAPTNHR